ncbi:hypothetical protein [Sphingomonas radiodurans]|uniref:hypothetical protein n=1 Tax=Sphingomonas radiodurans TaxID=2890321 RepID=UPI001E50BCF8|nr:hypothetical protein [Sphingomonas radiodurans]WBH16505.1 hypothetical protein LLW23_17240 [Sphingomonas radiodurans]
MEAFDVIVTQAYGRAEAQLVIQLCFNDLIDETERRGGFVPRTANSEMEQEEQLALSMEVERDLRGQVAEVNFTGLVLTQAQASLDQSGRYARSCRSTPGSS